MGLIANDTFTGTNGTNLTAHTLDSGGSWTAVSGTVTLNASNQATNTVNTAWYVTSTSASDVQIKLDVSTLATGYTGIIFRYQDSSNFLMCMIDAADFSPAKLTIWKRVGGSSSIVTSGTFVGVPATIVLTAVGTSITATDGTNTISATVSNFVSNTSHGLYFAGGAGGVVDNFKVYNVLSVTLTPNAVAQVASVSGSAVGTSPWNQIDNVKVEDATNGSLVGDADCALTSAYSYVMKCSNFNAGTAISADSSIIGIQVQIKKQMFSSGSATAAVTDTIVRLAYSAAAVGNDKSDPLAWPTNLTTEAYGGVADTWGWAGMSTAKILDPSFAVWLQVFNGVNAGDAAVDVVKVVLTYTPAVIPTFFAAECPFITRRIEMTPY